MPTPSLGGFQNVLLNKEFQVLVGLISTGSGGADSILTFSGAIQVTYSLEYLAIVKYVRGRQLK